MMTDTQPEYRQPQGAWVGILPGDELSTRSSTGVGIDYAEDRAPGVFQEVFPQWSAEGYLQGMPSHAILPSTHGEQPGVGSMLERGHGTHHGSDEKILGGVKASTRIRRKRPQRAGRTPDAAGPNSVPAGRKTARRKRPAKGGRNNGGKKTTGWLPEEDLLLLQLHEKLGRRWSSISENISGRTPCAVRRRIFWLNDATNKTNSSVTKKRVPKNAGTGHLADECRSLNDASVCHPSSLQGPSKEDNRGGADDAVRVKEKRAPATGATIPQAAALRFGTARDVTNSIVCDGKVSAAHTTEQTKPLGDGVQQLGDPSCNAFSIHDGLVSFYHRDNRVTGEIRQADASAWVQPGGIGLRSPSVDYAFQTLPLNETGLRTQLSRSSEPVAGQEKWSNCREDFRESHELPGQQAPPTDFNCTLGSAPQIQTPPTETSSCPLLSTDHSRCSSSPSPLDTPPHSDEQQHELTPSLLPDQQKYALDPAQLYLIDLEVSSLEHELLSPVARSVLQYQQFRLAMDSAQVFLIDQHVSGVADEFTLSMLGPPRPLHCAGTAPTQHTTGLCSRPDLTLFQEGFESYQTPGLLAGLTEQEQKQAEFASESFGTAPPRRSEMSEFPLLHQFEETHRSQGHHESDSNS